MTTMFSRVKIWFQDLFLGAPLDQRAIKLDHRPTRRGSEATPERWEHGWKTPRVTATRYLSKSMGFWIEFKFPRNAYDCDHPLIMDFIKQRSGYVIQCGGFPGAPVCVSFKDVTDQATADQKLLEILPAFDQRMAQVTAETVRAGA